MKPILNKGIILVDGVCNLCNNAVQFIIKHDPKQYFVFVVLQSDVAKELLLQFPEVFTKKERIIFLVRNWI